MFKYLRFAFIGSFLLLCACEADIVEVDLNRKDIESVLSGEKVMVAFTAKFSQSGQITDEQRTQIEALREVAKEYLDIQKFSLDGTKDGFEISIEGKLPMSMQPQPQSAWYLQIEEYPKIEGYHVLTMKSSDAFATLAARSEAINPMMTPDRFHPVEFNVNAAGMRILAPAAEVGGTTFLLFDEELTDPVSLGFRGGAFVQTGAGFLFSLK